VLTRLILVLGLIVGGFSWGSPADPPADLMRTEDVVRMLVTGTSTSEAVAAIRSRDVDFNLSEEMLDELRLAGVPDEVIEAMKERQIELHPPSASEVEELETEADENELPLVVV